MSCVRVVRATNFSNLHSDHSLLDPSQGHKSAVPAAPKPGDRSLMTPAQKKEADAKAMAEKAAKKAAGPDAAAGGKKK